MKKLFRTFLGLAAALAVTAGPIYATVDLTQFLQNPEPVAITVSADDTSTALLIRSFHAGGGSFTVDGTSGDLTFYKVDTATGTTAEDEFECPVSAPLGGVIDVSNAACDTLGEIVDIINASTSWRAVILDGERSTVVASAGMLEGKAQLDSNVVAGIPVYYDSSAFLEEYRAVVPDEYRSIATYLNGRVLKTNPFAGTQTVLSDVDEVSSFSGGQAFFYVKASEQDFSAGSETVSTLASRTSGTTAVYTTHTFAGGAGLLGPRNNKLLLHIDGGTGTVGTFRVTGAAAFGPYKR